MPAPFNNYETTFRLPHVIQDPAIRQNFEALVGLSSTTAMPNPTTGEIAPDGPAGGGGGGGGITWDTDYIAAEEQSTTTTGWVDLTTTGPTVSVDIPTNSLVWVVTSVVVRHPNNIAGSAYRVYNTSGNFDLSCAVGTGTANTVAHSPGSYDAFVGGVPTKPQFAGDMGTFSDNFTTPNTLHPPVAMFFYTGAALTGEAFKLQYCSVVSGGTYSQFKERRLTVAVLSL